MKDTFKENITENNSKPSTSFNDKDTFKENITENCNKLSAFFSAKDSLGITSLYTESAEILAPNIKVVTGKENINKFWQAFFDTGADELTLKTTEIKRCNELVIEVGEYEVFTNVDNEKYITTCVDNGKYIVIWKMEGGCWKLHRDIFNSSR